MLRAVLSESMRYKPVGPVVIRQATEDLQLPVVPRMEMQQQTQQPLERYHIRRDDAVVVNLAYMHRDKEVGPVGMG